MKESSARVSTSTVFFRITLSIKIRDKIFHYFITNLSVQLVVTGAVVSIILPHDLSIYCLMNSDWWISLFTRQTSISNKKCIVGMNRFHATCMPYSSLISPKEVSSLGKFVPKKKYNPAATYRIWSDPEVIKLDQPPLSVNYRIGCCPSIGKLTPARSSSTLK